MPWIKLYSGTATDPKFRLIARDAGVSTAEALGVWLMILEKASDADGDAYGFNPRLADIAFDMPDGSAAKVILAMQDLEMLHGMQVAAWESRQGTQSGKSAVTGYDRVKRYRDKRKNDNANDNADNANDNADNGNDNGIKNRIDKNREEFKNTPPLPPRGGAVSGKPPAPHSLPERKPPEPDMEFTQLRQLWDAHVMPEAELAGFTEYLGLKKARAWPGLLAIQQDVLERKTSAYWKPGYEPGLASYLKTRGWTAPKTNPRASPQSAASVKSFAELAEEREEQRWQRLRANPPKFDRKPEEDAQVCNG